MWTLTYRGGSSGHDVILRNTSTYPPDCFTFPKLVLVQRPSLALTMSLRTARALPEESTRHSETRRLNDQSGDLFLVSGLKISIPTRRATWKGVCLLSNDSNGFQPRHHISLWALSALNDIERYWFTFLECVVTLHLDRRVVDKTSGPP